MRRPFVLLAAIGLLLGCDDKRTQRLERATVTVLSSPQPALPARQEPDGVVLPVGIAAVIQFKLFDDKGAPFESPSQMKVSTDPNIGMKPIKDQQMTYLIWGREPGVTSFLFEPTDKAREDDNSGSATVGIYVDVQPHEPSGQGGQGGMGGSAQAGAAGQAGAGESGAGQSGAGQGGSSAGGSGSAGEAGAGAAGAPGSSGQSGAGGEGQGGAAGEAGQSGAGGEGGSVAGGGQGGDAG